MKHRREIKYEMVVQIGHLLPSGPNWTSFQMSNGGLLKTSFTICGSLRTSFEHEGLPACQINQVNTSINAGLKSFH